MMENNTINTDKQNRYDFASCGKLNPYSKSKGPSGNPEMLKLLKIYSHNTYPKHLITDNQKFIFLRDLLRENGVVEEVFVDLANILAIKKTKIFESIEEYRMKYPENVRIKPIKYRPKLQF